MKTPAKFVGFLLPIIIIAISILVFIALFKSKPPAQQKIVEEKIWFVESQTIELSSHKPIMRLIGKVVSAENIEITSAIEADVEKRWVSIGDKVSKGQKLLSLDKTTLKLIEALRQSEKNEIMAKIDEENKRHVADIKLLSKEKSLLAIANNAVARAQTLEKSSMASSSQLDDARQTSLNQQIAITKRQLTIDNHPVRLLQLQEKLKVASVRLAIAKEDLTHTIVSAPVDGVITQINLDQAEHVRIGSNLVTLYNNKKLELKAFVPEKYVSTILIALNNNTILTGTTRINDNSPIHLLRIGGEIQNNTAGSHLFFSIDVPSNQLVPGQTLPIQLNMPNIENSVSLPSDAIYGVDHVFAIKDERLRRVSITWLGETLGLNKLTEKYEINFLIQSDELKNGDTILINKFANAMDGLKVTTSSIK